jgi:iron complex transport system substrate-binding protein
MRRGVLLAVAGALVIGVAVLLFRALPQPPERTAGVPHRIVSLAPSETEILFALGVGDRVVGVTEWCDYPAEAQTRTKVGGYIDFSIEKVVGLAPDLVVAAYGIPKERIARLEGLGVRVFAENPHDLQGVMEHIEKVGALVGAPRRAAEVVARMRRDLDAVKARTACLTDARRPRTMYGSWEPPVFVAGPGSFIDEAIRLAGGVNVAADAGTPWPVGYSIEKIIAHDPQVLVRGYNPTRGGSMGQDGRSVETLRRDPVWRSVDAVKTGRVYWIDENLLSRTGPRLVQGVQELARFLHPDLFPEAPSTAPTSRPTTGENGKDPTPPSGRPETRP